MKVTSQMRSSTLLHADVLPGEDGAEVYLALAETDPSAMGDGYGAAVQRVSEFA
jgi:hypothetical protein